MTTNSEAIIAHYIKYDEDKRLQQDIGPYEFARSCELLEQYFPPAPATILDVGGATGPYSFWAAARGYAVHLVDIVPRHIEQAREKALQPGTPHLAGMHVGDARSLDFPDNFADAVISHGPLYHITQREERVQVLREAKRILKPGGVICAFGITRYAGLMYGIQQGLIFDADYRRMIADEVRTGLRMDPPEGVFTLPEAYFHLPEELLSEVRDAGFACERVIGVMGPGWMVPDLDASWQETDQREALMALARLTENEPALGPRLLAVGYKR